MTAKKPYRILSLDGGGIRGLTSAILLECLEKKLQEHEHKPEAKLKDYFDIIAGTSTGSIIACGVAKGIDATTIKNFYLNKGIEIFPPFWNVFQSLLSRIVGGYTQPIYDGKGLEKVLKDEKDVFGEALLFENLYKPTLVTSYDTYNRQAVVFKNTEFLLGKIPVWEICRASAAAPVAFPAHEMKDKHFLQYWKEKGYEIPTEGGIPLIDGGVVANDPALCAIAERLHWNLVPPPDKEKWIPHPEHTWVEVKDIVVASFGTGQPTLRRIGIKEARGWGAGEWTNPFNGVPIVDILFDGSSDVTDYIAQQILWKENYFRFQPNLDEASSIPPFNANPHKLDALKNRVEIYCQKVDAQLNQLVKSLTSETTKQSVVGGEDVTPI